MSVPAENLNIRTARKATIKRASAAARISLRRIDRRALERLTDLYEQTRNEIQEHILSAADLGGTVRLQNLQGLLAQVNGRLRDLQTARNDLFGTELLTAAQNGITPFSSVTVGTRFNLLAEESVRFVQSFVDEGGLQLADRLWRIDSGARDAVGNAIERSVILGNSASESAQDFLSRGVEVPADVRKKLNEASAEKISRITGRAFMTGEGNAYQKALRVFRTEINRAHNHAYEAAAFELEDVAGTRFLLSPNHPRPDICDMHANVNRYGLGAGVYPQGKNPYPAHPNTLSFIEVVFSDEITEQDRKKKQDRIEWLNDQSPGVQQAVLGSTKKRAALERGLLKENQIATPWRDLKPRFARQGVDVDTLTVTPAEPVGITSARLPTSITAIGSPVSGAFEAKAHAVTSEHVLNQIDAVHGDGRLPVIPIKNSPANASFEGAYRYTRGGDAAGISLRAGGSVKDFTLTHEIGHFLDHKGVPGAGFSSVKDPRFERWRQAIDNTPEVRHLRSLLSGPRVIEVPDGAVTIPRSTLRYLVSYEELWARSYSQYIAVRSGDKVLLDQLNFERRLGTNGVIQLPPQWQDDHFLSVSKEIDNLFEGLGWLKK